MFKGLFLSALCMLSCSAKAIEPSVDQIDSYKPKILEKREAPRTSYLRGGFNYQSTFDEEDLNYLYDTYGQSSYELVIDNPQDLEYFPYNCPFCKGDQSYQQLYLTSITFTVVFADDCIRIEYNLLDLYAADFSYTDYFYLYNPLSYLDYPSAYFYYYYSMNLSGVYYDFFNIIYTIEDNQYTTTYTGYYNFHTGLTDLNTKVAVFGYVNFNQALYKGFTNYEYPSNKIGFYYFDVESSINTLKVYDLPFSSDPTIQYSQFYFNGCKMSVSTYNYLNSVGDFAFIHDPTYDDSTFYDLLFGIMDSPIYFIQQLLGFELFGINLFFALTSMLTLLLILVLIRRFW